MKRHSFRSMVAITATAASLLVAPGLVSTSIAAPAAAAAPSYPIDGSTVGFADVADLYLGDDATRNRVLDATRDVGGKAVRVIVPWSYIEQVKGQRDFSRVDAQINAAIARGQSVIAMISGSPMWMSGATTPSGALAVPPKDNAAFAEFAGAVAQRYQAQVSAYEVWNEPNGQIFWSTGVSPEGYTALLRAAYPAIKAQDPSAPVLAAGLGAIATTGSTLAPPEFVKRMYAAGAQGSFDAMAYHPYQYTLKFSDGLTLPGTPLRQVQEIRASMVAAGDSGKKIWVTEMGYPTHRIGSENSAGDMLVDFLASWRQLPFAGPVMVYQPRDINTSPRWFLLAAENNFGLLRTDFSPKPGYTKLKTYLAAAPAPTPFAGAPDPGLGELISPVFSYAASRGLFVAPLRIPARMFTGGVQFALANGTYSQWTTAQYWAGAPRGAKPPGA